MDSMKGGNMLEQAEATKGVVMILSVTSSIISLYFLMASYVLVLVPADSRSVKKKIRLAYASKVCSRDICCRSYFIRRMSFFIFVVPGSPTCLSISTYFRVISQALSISLL
jgi:hypothetical protein